jgi:hypothetical protein
MKYFGSWIRKLLSAGFSRPVSSSSSRKRPRRLELECLEDRLVPTVLFGTTPRTLDPAPSSQVINHPHVELVVWGPAWTVNASTPTVNAVQTAADSILTGPYLTGLSQYLSPDQNGVGSVLGTLVSRDAPPANRGYDRLTVGNWLAQKIDNGTLPSPTSDPDLLYVVIMPEGVLQDRNGFFGNHSFATDGQGHNLHFAYIGNNGTLDTITKTFSHEVVEAMTDPEGNTWQVVPSARGISDSWNEIADGEGQMYTYRLNGFLVQSYWSKADQHYIIPTDPAPVLTIGGLDTKPPPQGFETIDDNSTVVFHNLTYMAGQDDTQHFFIRVNGGAPHYLDFDGKSQGPPSLAVFKDQLFMAWTGVDGIGHLNVAPVNLDADGIPRSYSNPVILSDFSGNGPALEVYADTLFIAWTGADGNGLYVDYSQDGTMFGHEFPDLGKSSASHSPALKSWTDGNLYLSWPGSFAQVEVFGKVQQALPTPSPMTLPVQGTNVTIDTTGDFLQVTVDGVVSLYDYGLISGINITAASTLTLDDRSASGVADWNVNATYLDDVARGLNIFYSSAVNNVDLLTSDFSAAHVNVFGAPSGTAIEVQSGAGGSAVTIGDGVSGLPLAALTIVGGTGLDSVTVDDRYVTNPNLVLSPTLVKQSTLLPTFTITDQTVVRTWNQGPFFPVLQTTINYSGIEQLTVDGGPQTNTFAVQSVASGTQTNLVAGSGRNTVTVGDANDTLDAIVGGLDIEGAGTTRLVLDDSALAQQDPNLMELGVNFSISAGTVVRSHTQSFADALGTVTSLTTQTITFTDVPTLVIEGGSTTTTFDVQGNAAGTDLSIGAGPGQNTFNVGDATGVLDPVAGAVHIQGQGTGSLVVDDSGLVPDPFFTNESTAWTLAADTIQYSHQQTYTDAFGPLTFANTATITFTGVPSVVVKGGNIGDLYQITGTATGTNTSVIGGAGDDTFTVGSAGQPLDSILGLLTLDGGASSNTLTVNDQGNQATTWTRSPGRLIQDRLAGPTAGRTEIDYSNFSTPVINANATIPINASTLLGSYLTLDDVVQNPATSFGPQLQPGTHWLHGRGGDYVYFNVAADGTIDYDPALEGVLSGRGTDALSVHGVTVQIDASALSGSHVTLDDVVENPATSFSAQLLPGTHWLHGRGGDYVYFNVAADGTISYDPALGRILTTGGPGSLSVHGAQVQIDASALSGSYLTLDDVAQQNPATPFSALLLPGTHWLQGSGGDYIYFTVAANGTIDFNAVDGVVIQRI